MGGCGTPVCLESDKNLKIGKNCLFELAFLFFALKLFQSTIVPHFVIILSFSLNLISSLNPATFSNLQTRSEPNLNQIRPELDPTRSKPGPNPTQSKPELGLNLAQNLFMVHGSWFMVHVSGLEFGFRVRGSGFRGSGSGSRPCLDAMGLMDGMG